MYIIKKILKSKDLNYSVPMQTYLKLCKAMVKYTPHRCGEKIGIIGFNIRD